MQDITSILLILQASSMSISLFLCLTLIFSRLHKPDTTASYEHTRWLLAAAMGVLAIHYALQIICGFRAQNDEAGALVNILFYCPVVYVLSYSMVRIGCGRSYQRRYLWSSLISLTLIYGTFIYGYLRYGSLQMTGPLHLMALLYFLTAVFLVVYPVKEIRRMRKLLDEESGQEPVPFNLYMRTSTLLLNIASILVPFCIFYTPALVIIGPLFFVVLTFYITSFIALGFNMQQIKGIASDVTEEASKTLMDDALKANVRQLLDQWQKAKGFSSSEINSVTLAFRLGIPKRQLIQYLHEEEGKTFRVWLSDLRLDEAKRLISLHPELSNENVAESCGFSRSHLQIKFKEATGLTPNEWREKPHPLNRP